MPLFSEIVRDSAENLGLGNKAAALVAAASRAVFDPGEGGLRGFLARCDKAGLTELTRSWQDSSEPPKPLSGAQLESVIGRDVVTLAGRDLGMANARVRTAMAFVVPQLVRVFSREGEAPTDIPPALEMFLTSASAGRTAPTSKQVARNPGPAPVSRLWTLGVVVLMVSASWLGYDVWHEQSRSGKPEVQQAPALATLPNTHVTQPPVDSVPEHVVSRSAWLSIRNNNGQFVYSGVVADVQTQSALVNRMKAVWGDRQSGSLTLDPAVPAAGWLPAFDRLLPQLDIRGLDVRLDGNMVKVGGWLPDKARQAALTVLKTTLGSEFHYGYRRDEETELTQDSHDLVLAGLSVLPLGATAAEVAAVLNRWSVGFAETSAVFPEESKDVAVRAAEVIRRLPGPLTFEIAVYTDNRGDDASRLALTQDRANAIRLALVRAGVASSLLLAKGYGSISPVAGNDSAYGRYMNRRVEFKPDQPCGSGVACPPAVSNSVSPAKNATVTSEDRNPVAPSVTPAQRNSGAPPPRSAARSNGSPSGSDAEKPTPTLPAPIKPRPRPRSPVTTQELF